MKLRTKKEYLEGIRVQREYARAAAAKVGKREPKTRQYMDKDGRIWTLSTDGFYYHQQYILTQSDVSTMAIVGALKSIPDEDPEDY